VQASPIGSIAISRQSCVDFARIGGGTIPIRRMARTASSFPADNPARCSATGSTTRIPLRGRRSIDRAPAKEDAVALLVESALADAGSFACSDPLLNRIHAVNRWTQRCLNLGSYYVDCPTRERMGYGDGQVAIQGMMMNFDAGRFYAKWAQDWRLGLEMRRGYLPYVAPPFEKSGGGPPWPGGIARIPWEHYLRHGDAAVLEENLDGARKYCEYLDGRSTDDVLRAWAADSTSSATGCRPAAAWTPRTGRARKWPRCSATVSGFISGSWWSTCRRPLAHCRKEHARQRADAIRAATHAAFYDAANKRM